MKACLVSYSSSIKKLEDATITLALHGCDKHCNILTSLNIVKDGATLFSQELTLLPANVNGRDGRSGEFSNGICVFNEYDSDTMELYFVPLHTNVVLEQTVKHAHTARTLVKQPPSRPAAQAYLSLGKHYRSANR